MDSSPRCTKCHTEMDYFDGKLQCRPCHLRKELDAARAESAALRAAVAEAEKQRDEANKMRFFYEGKHIAAHNKLMRVGCNYDPLNVVTNGIDALQKSRDALAAELAEARKVLDSLPKTADGVVVYLGMTVWAEMLDDYEDDLDPGAVIHSITRDQAGDVVLTLRDFRGEKGPHFIDEVAPENCYSTREAALAARDSASKDNSRDARGGGGDAR